MSSQHLFWDTCVFIRYLTNDTNSPFFSDISSYIDEAKRGKWKIYFSTITYAEIRQDYFQGGSFGSINAFFDSLGSNFIPVDPNPNILIQTGELRSATSTNPTDNNPPKQRAIATPDAIIMVSCLFARDALGITDIVLHSTDEGKGKGWAGRSVPVVGFDKWFPEPTRTPMVRKICSLQISTPMHPQPFLQGFTSRPDVNNPQPRL
jgi:hypothetical protein